MFDPYSRKIHYLRISVTDRCNLRCVYCMPPEGVAKPHHKDILTFDEIIAVTRAAVKLGIDKVRLTGGEPLVRRDIVTLTAMLAKIDGIRDLSMTTNATLLSKFATPLAQAGLKRINISLDSVDPEEFSRITRGGNLNEVFEGIQAAREAGLSPIKLNCVIDENANEPRAQAVAEYAEREGLELRFIRQMNTSKGEFWTVKGGDGGHCKTCNRLRLTSNGMIVPCLFSNLKFNVREMGPEAALLQAINEKPQAGLTSNNQFHAIGG